MKCIIEAGKFIVRHVLFCTPAGRRYYQKRKERQRAVSCETLQKYGSEVLSKVHAVMNREGIDYMVCFGTLLGCVRDGCLMAHDDDIDFAIPPPTHAHTAWNMTHLVEQLELEGFQFFWAWECQGRITEFAVEYKGIHVDFYLLHDGGGHLESHWYMPVKGIKYPDRKTWSTLCVSLPKPSRLVPLKLEKYGNEVMIPDNYDELLSSHYGSWRIPDPNWKASPNGGVETGNRRFLREYGHQVSREEFIEKCR